MADDTSVKIHFPAEMLEAIDIARGATGTSRAEYVRNAVLNTLKEGLTLATLIGTFTGANTDAENE